MEVSWFLSHARRFCDYLVSMHGGLVVFIPCTEVLWLFSSNARRFRIFFLVRGFVIFLLSLLDFFPHFFRKTAILFLQTTNFYILLVCANLFELSGWNILVIYSFKRCDQIFFNIYRFQCPDWSASLYPYD